ncbi:ComEA family DNA-binding protein [Candidatus Poribacteria bacterium]|nr:MAG: ComEA family DNA-binding protein [Candidatus Poribacteria bacterium]
MLLTDRERRALILIGSALVLGIALIGLKAHKPSIFLGPPDCVAGQRRSITVHLTGCVRKPDVYEVEEGTRLFELLRKAGGPTEEADLEAVNLAMILRDGQRVFIPSRSRRAKPGHIPLKTLSKPSPTGKVNLNTASKEELESLPGIGPKLAERIIEYRRSRGGFRSIEEIKAVKGIGEKKFQALKDLITVR